MTNAGIGHNSGEKTEDENQTKYEKLLAFSNEIVEAVARFQDAVKNGIDDEETAGKAGKFLTRIKAHRSDSEKQRKIDVEPSNKTTKKINAEYAIIKEAMTGAVGMVEGKLSGFLAKKREEQEAARLEAEKAEAEARQKAERLRKEAEESDNLEQQLAAKEAEKQVKAAAKETKEAAKNKGISGGSVSGRSKSHRVVAVHKAKITHIDLAAKHYKNHPQVIELLERLASAELRADHDLIIDGFERHITDEIR